MHYGLRDDYSCANIRGMGVKTVNSAATHLGRTMRRDREAHHWTLREFSSRTEINYATLSRVENGHRPFFERLAVACDKQFPERRGWYLEYYEESKSWTPAGFRSWAEYEDKASTLRVWTPGLVDGMIQTSDYAHALLSTVPGVSAEVIAARLASRLQRQQRILYRPEPPLVSFVVDEMALYRCVGSPETMAAQMRHMIEVASLPHVTIQVLRAVQNPVGASSFMLAGDDAAYAEHILGGYVFTDVETVTTARLLFTTINSESYTASESLVRLAKMEEIWTGVSPVTAARKADSA